MQPDLIALPLLSPADARRLFEGAEAADREGLLQVRQRALLHRRGWLTLLAPRVLGGAGMPLPDAVRLQAAIAAVDGSSAWVVTLCAGAAWFCGFLPQALAREVMQTPRVCITGSGAPTGAAHREGEGWRIDGRWMHASGAELATHFTMNAVLHQDGQPLRDAQGRPRVSAFILPAARVLVQRTWDSMGLRATGSHAFRVESQWVTADHAFDIHPSAATFPGPLYRFPFVPLAFVTLAANVAGMARNFLHLAGPIVLARRHPLAGCAMAEVQGTAAMLRRASDRLASAQARVDELLERAWEQVVRGSELQPAAQDALNAACLHLVDEARQSVDSVFPFAGLQAARPGSAINRAWRDLHTATQHALLIPSLPGA